MAIHLFFSISTQFSGKPLSFQLSISFFGCVVLWLLIWKLLGLCFQVPIGVILFSFLYSKGELSSVPLRRGVLCSFHVLLFVLDEEQWLCLRITECTECSWIRGRERLIILHLKNRTSMECMRQGNQNRALSEGFTHPIATCSSLPGKHAVCGQRVNFSQLPYFSIPSCIYINFW